MLGILGLITLSALAVFSLLYLSSSIPKKPPAVEKAVAAIKRNIDDIGVVTLVYGLFATFAVPVLMAGMLSSGVSIAAMFLPMFANLTLVIMALPYAFHRFEAGLKAKVNAAILTEIHNIMIWITTNEKYVGALGAALIVLCLAIHAF
ncbi:MAG: hypothetical protein K0R10_1746 [Alphaproteobacteria bacterium]|jgi:hypothetical protein|nr:hypothetical protein [Alphaproteobacteria bacterium]